MCRLSCLPPGVHVHGRLEVPRGAHGLSGRARRCGGRTKAEGGGGRRRPAGGGPLAAGGWRPALHSPPLPPSLYATTRRWSVSLDGIDCLARFLFDGAAVRAKSLTLYCRVSMCAREGWYMCTMWLATWLAALHAPAVVGVAVDERLARATKADTNSPPRRRPSPCALRSRR